MVYLFLFHSRGLVVYITITVVGLLFMLKKRFIRGIRCSGCTFVSLWKFADEWCVLWNCRTG